MSIKGYSVVKSSVNDMVSVQDKSEGFGITLDGTKNYMKKSQTAVHYKLSEKYPNVRFSGTSVSQPIKSVDFKVGYWVYDLQTDDKYIHQDKFRRSKKIILNHPNVGQFTDRYITFMDFPSTTKSKKSWISFTFHLFTKGEPDKMSITQFLEDVSKEIYEDVFKV